MGIGGEGSRESAVTHLQNWKAKQKPRINRFAEVAKSSPKTPSQELQESRQSEQKLARELFQSFKDKDAAEHLSLHDPLTGLLNRRGLVEVIEGRVIIAKRQGVYEPAVIVSNDLDGLGIVNDKFGHKEGDKHIQKNAAAIVAGIRETDVAAREGGDEFMAVLFGTDIEQAKEVCRRIQEEMEARGVSGSLGIAQLDYSSPEMIDESMELADLAMYKTKKERKQKARENLTTDIVYTASDLTVDELNNRETLKKEANRREKDAKPQADLIEAA